MAQLIRPHGGRLAELYAAADDATSLKSEAMTFPNWTLTQRQICDVKLLLNGGFSPLQGFLDQPDYDRVVSDMRLGDGTVWPIPITLDVTSDFADGLAVGDRVALRDPEGFLIAVLSIGSIWQPDKNSEADGVYGTHDRTHSGVNHLLGRSHEVYLGGRLTGVTKPVDYDFRQHRHDPATLRQLFQQWGWTRTSSHFRRATPCTARTRN